MTRERQCEHTLPLRENGTSPGRGTTTDRVREQFALWLSLLARLEL